MIKVHPQMSFKQILNDIKYSPFPGAEVGSEHIPIEIIQPSGKSHISLIGNFDFSNIRDQIQEQISFILPDHKISIEIDHEWTRFIKNAEDLVCYSELIESITEMNNGLKPSLTIKDQSEGSMRASNETGPVCLLIENLQKVNSDSIQDFVEGVLSEITADETDMGGSLENIEALPQLVSYLNGNGKSEDVSFFGTERGKLLCLYHSDKKGEEMNEKIRAMKNSLSDIDDQVIKFQIQTESERRILDKDLKEILRGLTYKFQQDRDDDEQYEIVIVGEGIKLSKIEKKLERKEIKVLKIHTIHLGSHLGITDKRTLSNLITLLKRDFKKEMKNTQVNLKKLKVEDHKLTYTEHFSEEEAHNLKKSFDSVLIKQVIPSILVDKVIIFKANYAEVNAEDTDLLEEEGKFEDADVSDLLKQGNV